MRRDAVNPRKVLDLLADGRARTAAEIADEAGFRTPAHIYRTLRALSACGAVVQAGTRSVPGWEYRPARLWRLADGKEGDEKE